MSLRRPLVLALLVACHGRDTDETDVLDTDTDTDTDTDDDTDVEVERLDPASIDQFAQPLLVPPAMPPTATGDVVSYEIAVGQFQQQVLPAPLPKTTVWGYGAAGNVATFNAPGFTIETRTDEAVRVKWINGLVDDDGHYLPHLLPVDPTLMWANPTGPIETEGVSPEPYTGPVPMVVHLHGGHMDADFDGGPRAWWLPDANDLPEGTTARGSDYRTAEATDAGAAVYDYDNSQPASTLWIHDHTLGMTRLNVYAGPASFWIVRDAEEDALDLPGPAPAVGDAAGTRYYEIPLAIQDRSFTTDGQLYYPSSREEFDGYEGPYRPTTDVPPIWNPEVFGDVMIVNGRAWPYLEVEPRLYRFRVLNGTNARFLDLALDDEAVGITQIGADGGLLPEPVERQSMVLAPAERADLIVDFSGLAPGATVTLLNRAPDAPYQGPDAEDAVPADPETTGRVLQFRVVTGTGEGDPGSIPTALPPIDRLETLLPPRDLMLAEQMLDDEIPTEAMLGTVRDGPLDYDDLTTERPTLGDTEIWRIANTTGDAHPIHMHLVQFQVVERAPYDEEAFLAAQRAWLANSGPEPVLDDFVDGPTVPAEPWEKGWKDTVVANPGEVTSVIATFDKPGRFLWHCHLLEHEDNEMMREFEVVTP
jgi:spore coat protein A, manganese oxidase